MMLMLRRRTTGSRREVTLWTAPRVLRNSTKQLRRYGNECKGECSVGASCRPMALSSLRIG